MHSVQCAQGLAHSRCCVCTNLDVAAAPATLEMMEGPLSTCLLAFSGSHPIPGSGGVTEWVDSPGSLVRPARPLWYKLTQHLRAQHRQGAVGLGIEDPGSGPCPVTYQPWDLGQEISYVPVLFLMIHCRLSKKVASFVPYDTF